MTAMFDLMVRFVAPPPGGGEGLPGPLRQAMESFFDTDFGEVRLYSSDLATRMGALAFASGNDIVFAPGCYRPDTVEGLYLLGHELAHVVQQRRCLARAGEPLALVADASLECEADLLGIGAAAYVLGREDYLAGRTAPRRPAAPPFVAGIPSSRARADREAGRVIQCQTQLDYATKVKIAPTDRIVGGWHSREIHNDTQKKLVAYLCGYNSPSAAINDGCENVCNHYVPYQHVRDAVLSALKKSKNVAAAAKWLNGIHIPGQIYYGTLWGQPKNAWNFMVGELPRVVLYMASGCYDQNDINREVDDLIYNLANDPRNMFYAATSTGDFKGTAIDRPLTLGPNAQVTVVNLVQRLEAYRALMNGQGVKV
ncbi:DUF4157 domain-containing protein [Sphingomonas sp. ABOLD]|nr:DUF4157 domain-containing protein [Sphingomonas sp. ABOLE]RSV40883.1 DUF4157 domain-containing protein [Sphingomonas sp. ABOLE]RSV44537.1 DUF4157 domain-containing protein [Sphingomonas sp. ABOLD]